MYSQEPSDNRGRLVRIENAVPSRASLHQQLAQVGPPDYAIDSDIIDLSEIWLTFRKYKWTIICFTTLIVAATIIGTLLMRPVYQSTTTIQIRPAGPQILEYQDLGLNPANQLSQNNYYQTQYEILRSRFLASAVINELDLLSDPEINGEIGQRSPMVMVNKLIGGIRAIADNFKADGNEENPSGLREPHERAVDRFLGKLSITPVRDSELVRISFDSFNPDLSARVVNTLVQKYIESNMQRYHDAGEAAREFLRTQLVDMQQNLERADQSLHDFAVRKDISDLAERIDLESEKLANLESRLTDVQQEKVVYKVKHDQIAAGRGAVLPEIVDSALINTLQQELIQQRAEYSQLLGRFKPDYPDLVTLRNRIEKLENQIEAEKSRIQESIVDRYEGLVKQENAIKENIRQQESTLLALNQSSIEYNILKREVDANKELYDGLLQRVKEIGVASGVRENNVAMIDSAEPALAPYKPDLKFNAMMALVLGSMGGTGLAFFLRFLDNTVRRPEDVESLVYLPTLGVIPQIGKDETTGSVTSEALAFCSVDQPQSLGSEAYHSLCFNLMFSLPTGMPQTLVVTSANPVDGKTTTACNLACVLAQSGKRTLLIDADFRRPRIHKLFGQTQSPGLTQRIAAYNDLMTGSKCRCLYTSHVENLYVMTSGSIPRNPAEQLAPDRIRILLEALGRLFDHIIIDSPPVMGMADVLSLSRAADGVVLVVSSGETTKAALKYSVQRLRQIHAPVLGVVINNADLQSPEYSSYQRDYYPHQSLPGTANVIEAPVLGQIDRKAS